MCIIRAISWSLDFCSMTGRSSKSDEMLIYTKLGNCQYKQNIWKISTQVFYVNRYYWIIITIAILMGISRIFMSMHFPSDILFGAYLGSLIPILLYKLYTKIKKNFNFEILARVPPFCKTKNFFRTWQPSDFLRSVKMLPIDFSSQTT